MENVFLTISKDRNIFLNADELTARRTIALINGESYELYLKFLSGSGVISPAIDELLFTVREHLEGADILAATGFLPGSGDYSWKIPLVCSSPFLNLALSGQETVDLVAQLAYSDASELEVIAPVTARFTNTSSGAGNLAYVTSVNGVSGAVQLTGQNGLTVSAQGQNIFVSGDFVSHSQTGVFATAQNLRNTGAALSGQIAALQGQTGSYYQNSNPSGFATTGQVSAASGALQAQVTSLTSNLASTGSNLQTQVSALQSQTGNYYSKSNPSGYATTGQVAASISSASGALHAEITGVSGLTNGVVRTTGNQTVNGEKTFANDIYASDIRNGNGANVSILNASLYDTNGDGSLSWGARLMLDNALGTSLDWGNRILSGNWKTNTVPTESGHIVNRGYLTSYIATGANTGSLATAANLASTGSGLQAQINTLNSVTGTLAANIAATGSGLQAQVSTIQGQITTLQGQTGSYATNAALSAATGTLGVRISALEGVSGSFALQSNLAATGSGLQTQISTLQGQTGSYYPRSSNPSGYLQSGALLPYATTGQLATVSGLTNGVVRTTGAQNVNGTKTFLDNIVTPNIGNTSDLAGIGVNVKQLYDTDGVTSIWWHDRFLSDLAGGTALEWDARRLWNTSNVVTLDWNNRQLHGNWLATGTPTQSGHIVNRGYLVNYVATGVNTGSLATAANLTATGAALSGQIAQLQSQTGSYLTTGTVATQSGLAATGSNLQSQISSLSSQVVYLTGVQEIGGSKSFTNQIRVDSIGGKTSFPITFSLSEGVIYDNDTEVPVVDFGNQILSATSGFANSLDWLNKFCYDSLGGPSVGWETRELYGTYGTGLNWQNGYLNNTGGLTTVAWHSENLLHNGITTLDWSACQLVDTGARNSLNWASRALIATGGETRVDWQNLRLSGNWSTNTVPTQNAHLVNLGYLQTGSFNLTNVVRTTGNQTISGTKSFAGTINATDLNAIAITNLSNGVSVDVVGAILNDTSAVESIDWTTRTLFDTSSNQSIDWGNRVTADSAGNAAINWGNRSLFDTAAITSVDWESKYLNDSSAFLSLNWTNRWLANNAGNTVLNWGTQTLTGNWSYQTLKGTVSSGNTASNKTINWDDGTYFYQPITGSGINFAFSNTKEGQTVTIVTFSTGSGLIQWPTGAGSVPVKWAGHVPFSGTSGSAATGKADVFTFVRLNNAIYASYSANHY